jgi:hypothetical protein
MTDSSFEKITWTTKTVRLSELIEWEKNPRQLSKHDGEHLQISLDKFGQADPLVVNADGKSLIGGHQRRRVLLAEHGGDFEVDVRVPSRLLDEREAAELNVRLNKNAGEFDFDLLANNFDVPDLVDWGFELGDLGIIGEEKLKEKVEVVRFRPMFHVLISVPVDFAIDVKDAVKNIENVPGVEIEYGANG